MASASVCLSLANDIRDADRDAVLARIDAYTATGMSPAQAQRLAARDTAAEIEADHDELMGLAREQAGPETEPATEAEPAPAKPNEFFSQPGTVEPVKFAPPGMETPDAPPMTPAALSAQSWKEALTKTLGDAAPTLQYAKDTAGTQAAIASLPPGHYVKWDNAKGKTFVYYGAQPVPGAVGKKTTDAVTAFHALAAKAKKAAPVAAGIAQQDSTKNTLKAILKTLPTPTFDVLKEHLDEANIAHTFWLSDEWVDKLSAKDTKAALAAATKAQDGTPTTAMTAKVAASPVLNKTVPQWDAPTTWEFKKWFGNSVAVLANGKPKVWLHGTARLFNTFKPKQAGAIFASPETTFAQWFVGISNTWMQSHQHEPGVKESTKSTIIPVWVKAENPWDYENEDHVDAMLEEWNRTRNEEGLGDLPANYRVQILKGNWKYIEESSYDPNYENDKRFMGVEAIQSLGHDSFYMAEVSSLTGKKAKNLGVFSPDQLKPALGPESPTWDAANAMLQSQMVPYGTKAELSRLANVGAYGQRAITDEEAAPYGMTGDQASVAQMGGDLRFSRETTDPTDPAYPPAKKKPFYTLSDFGKWGMFVEGIQDRYNRFEQAVTEIKEQGGKVTEANDFYQAEARYWGIVGTGIEDFNAEVTQWIEDMTKDGISLQDVSTYAVALHAQERNASIAAKRPSMPDGGSGMTNQDAQDILDEALQSGLKPVLDKHVAQMHKWIQGTRDLAYDQGLIDETEYLELTGMWDNYVPLRGLPEKFGAAKTTGTGSGYNAKGTFAREAKGRYSEAKNIIEQIMQDRSTTLIRAGKNQVVRSFAEFVLDNPSPNLWEIEATERKPVFKSDDAGNRWIEEEKTVITDPRTITLKDGGQDIHITIHDETLRKQLQNMHVENLPKLLVPLMVVNRTLSKLYTTFSPVFIAVNGVRDLQAASVGIIDELGWIGVPKLYAKMPAAFLDAWRAEVLGKPSADYQLYRATGGKTAFFGFKTIEEQAAELKTLVARAEQGPVDPRRLFRATKNLIEALNGAVENTTRFAAFQATKDTVDPSTGKKRTVAEASNVAKNITVNFNRKGTMTPTLSALFLFFNPAVQGTARIAKALKNPKVQIALAGAMVGMLALAMRNASMGDDDDGVAWWDKIPSEVKERNLIIILPPGVAGGDEIPETKTGRYIKVPMPYGYNFFAVVANQVADVWRHSQNPKHGRSITDAGMKAFQAATGAFIPSPELGRSFETPKSIALAFAPDAINPVMQNILNTNAFGREMRPDDSRTKSMPSSQRYFAPQAGSIFQRIAEKGNELGGGNKYMPAPGIGSILDQSPASIENLVRGYGGGMVQFGLDTINAIYLRQSIEREDLEPHRLPLIKQAWGVIDNETDRLVSTQRMNEIQMKSEPMAKAMKDGEGEALQEMIEAWGTAPLAMAPTLKETQKQLSELRKAELAIIQSDEPPSVKYARMQTFNAVRRKLLQGINSAYDSVLNAEPQVSAATALQ